MISIVILLLSLNAKAETVEYCDQVMYDTIYKEISRQVFRKDDYGDYDARFRAIETLRKLCRGQVSTWEKANQIFPVGSRQSK